MATSSFGHGITTNFLQLAKGYAIISNGGYDIKPTIIKSNNLNKKKSKIIKNISKDINLALRKIVTDKEGTAGFANISGYEIGGKLELLKKY